MTVPVYRILDVQAFERPVHLRLPFRFGDTTVEDTAEAHLVVSLEGEGGAVRGQSAQMMVPRWFDKREGLDNQDTIDELRATILAAERAAIGLSGSIARLSADLRRAVIDAMPEGTPRLAAGFGPALIEMALIDAACRDQGLAFTDAVRTDLFGIAADCPDDLDASALSAHLQATPRPRSLRVRHTVGFDAPLTAAEIVDGPDDGLPVALADVIAATGVSFFKIKLKGDPDLDLARLEAIATVLDQGPAFKASLDANEQYAEDSFKRFLDGFRADRRLERLCNNLLFIEQPFARENALSLDVHDLVRTVPLVIDESDDAPDAFSRAALRGWSGTSVKSCKGVLHALTNSARVAALQQQGRNAILTAEDLTCQPGLCWQQDTAMAIAAGASHGERNGHHFGGGMQGASDAEKARFLAAHPDIYSISATGPALRIHQGAVAITSLDRPGFGSDVLPDLSTCQTIAAEGERDR